MHDPTIIAAEKSRARRLDDEANIRKERANEERRKEKGPMPLKMAPKPVPKPPPAARRNWDEGHCTDNEEWCEWAYGRGKVNFGGLTLDNQVNFPAFRKQPEATKCPVLIERYLEEWEEDGGDARVPMPGRGGSARWKGYRVKMDEMLEEAIAKNEGALEKMEPEVERCGGSVQFGPSSGIPMRITYEAHQRAEEKRKASRMDEAEREKQGEWSVK